MNRIRRMGQKVGAGGRMGREEGGVASRGVNDIFTEPMEYCVKSSWCVWTRLDAPTYCMCALQSSLALPVQTE